MPSEMMDWTSTLIAGRHEVEPAEYIDIDPRPPPAPDAIPGDLARYLSMIFSEGEHVAVCSDSPDGEKVGRIAYNLTAGEIIAVLQAKKPLEDIFGDFHAEAGAWIGFNPLDGQGARDANVAAYRHALIQSDEGELGHQLSILRSLRLPCAAVIHSGGRSIHAIVKVDAANRSEYRDRVDYLYRIVAKAGLQVDGKHRYPSRLTRMPGVMRGLSHQYLIQPSGFETWAEWHEFMEDLHDDLPDIECLVDTKDNLPPLDPVVIAGMLRKGHKMLVSGPSKAGKSWGLESLCIAVATGSRWFGFPVTKGRALYVNCELARPSCLHRFHMVYDALNLPYDSMSEIDVWNIRGNCRSMDLLAPKLIRRAKERQGYSVIVVDPLYKVESGDENSAHVMAALFNQLEIVAFQTGAALIYSHHHSKGDQGGKKAGDRGAGSGVILRDPDALLDLIELVLPPARRQQLVDKIQIEQLGLVALDHGHEPERLEGDTETANGMLLALKGKVPDCDLDDAMARGAEIARLMEGFRLDGTLREFPKFQPRELWFRWPLHVPDDWELLKDAKASGEEPPWMAAQREKEKGAKERDRAAIEAINVGVQAAGGTGCTLADLCEHVGGTERNLRRRILKSKKWTIIAGKVEVKKGKHDDESALDV